jgi:hypothetical protein
LSQGALPPTLIKAKAELGLDEHNHRIRLQRTVANSALAFVAMLFMVAVVYGGVILFLLVGDPTAAMHWHASILVAAFVVPPTVVLVAVLRSVYSASEDEKNQSMLPIMTMVKDTAIAIAGMFKRGG